MSKKLKFINIKKSGRDNSGQVSVRHQGGRSKQFLRAIDFKRDKNGVIGQVTAIEYDPNRNVKIALVSYTDGEKRYILLPVGLKIGDKVVSSAEAEIKPGNALPLANIPLGQPIHNLELLPGKGGQILRGAGSMTVILSKENGMAQIKLPSGEIRLFPLACKATIGQLGNVDYKLRKLKKAGDSRHRGIRPTVRGVSQDPRSHPHGGGEGRSGIGMPGPKTPWGKPALGKKTRSKVKYSDKFIIKRKNESSVTAI